VERLIFGSGPTETGSTMTVDQIQQVRAALGEDDVDLERLYELWESDDKTWQAQAACRGMSPDLFFPGRGNNSFAVKAICAGCPVRTECLAWGTANERDGIWGGFAERSRQRFRARMRARGWDLDPIRHGSRATYLKYKCRCAACVQAVREYSMERSRRESVR